MFNINFERLVTIMIAFLSHLGSTVAADGREWPASCIPTWQVRREGEPPIESLVSFVSRELSISPHNAEAAIEFICRLSDSPFRIQWMKKDGQLRLDGDGNPIRTISLRSVNSSPAVPFVLPEGV